MFNERAQRIFALLLLAAACLAAYQAWRLFFHPSIKLEWATATELNTAGYHLYRGLSPDGPFERLTTQVLPATGDSLSGGRYSYVDKTVQPGVQYYYQLVEVELTGATSVQGVVMAEPARPGGLEAALALVMAGSGVFLLLASRERRESRAGTNE